MDYFKRLSDNNTTKPKTANIIKLEERYDGPVAQGTLKRKRKSVGRMKSPA